MTPNPKKVFIDGGHGTTGLELVNHLQAEPQLFEVVSLPKEARRSVSARTEAFQAADIIVLCLPDAAARSAVTLITELNLSAKILDTSTAHRTNPHWIYGFRELSGQTQKIIDAPHVTNPGCYAIGFIALIRPLIEKKLLPTDIPLTTHAVSGYSGGGKTLIETFESSPHHNQTHPYALYSWDLEHKHLSEMQLHSLLSQPPLFQPAVIDTYRGMIVTIPLHQSLLAQTQITAETIVTTLKNYYEPTAARTQNPTATTHTAAAPHSTHSAHGTHSSIDPAASIHSIPTTRPNPHDIVPHAVTVSTLDELRPKLTHGTFLPFNLTHESETLQIIIATSPQGHVMLHAQLDNLGKGAALNALANLKLMVQSL